MIDKKAIGERIHTVRVMKRIPQHEVLKDDKNSQVIVSRAENGVSGLNTIDNIADGLGVSLKVLLFEEDFDQWKRGSEEIPFTDGKPLPPLPFDEENEEVIAKIREVTDAINRQSDRLAAILTEISKEL